MNDIDGRYHDREVCIFGLGYVGLTLAVTMAEVGFRVHGVEIRAEVVEGLRHGQPPFHEFGLAAKLRRVIATGDFSAATTAARAREARVFIITVGTPLGADGLVRLEMIRRVTDEVAAMLKDGDLVIMRSTVRLGVTRTVVKPILDATGRRYELAFCPERTLEGQALEELRRLPQIIGAADRSTTLRCAHLFNFLTPTVVRVADLETAEVIKLIDNAQRDMLFGYANEVARICDAIGVSAAEVIAAGKLGYPRTNLPMPGPVGGPCLEKDPHILAESLLPLGIEPAITLAARRLNEAQPDEVVGFLAARLQALRAWPARPEIAVCGLAFKGRPATDDLRGTMARPIIAALRRRFPSARLRGYDPVVDTAGIRSLGLEPVGDPEAAFTGANLVVIQNNHPVFAGLAMADLAQHLARPGLVYDFWNHFTGQQLDLPPGTGYMALGSHARCDYKHLES